MDPNANNRGLKLYRGSISCIYCAANFDASGGLPP